MIFIGNLIRVLSIRKKTKNYHQLSVWHKYNFRIYSVPYIFILMLVDGARAHLGVLSLVLLYTELDARGVKFVKTFLCHTSRR